MNTNQQPDREKEIFAQAVEITAAQERHAFLNLACAGEPALRARLDALLRSHDEASPACGLDETLLNVIGETHSHCSRTTNETGGTLVSQFVRHFANGETRTREIKLGALVWDSIVPASGRRPLPACCQFATGRAG